MGSVIVSVSIPEEMRPLWDRLSEAHKGSSRFVQWTLATLAQVEMEGLDRQARALRSESIRARVAFLQANVEAEQTEMTQLALLAGERPGPVATSRSPDAWWDEMVAKRGRSWVFSLSEKQVGCLARYAGADPEACVTLARRFRTQYAEAFARRLSPESTSR